MRWLLGAIGIMSAGACSGSRSGVEPEPLPAPEAPPAPHAGADVQERLAIYAPVRLTADLSPLSDRERQMVAILIRASQIMDDLFWQNAYPDREGLLARATDPAMRRLIEINYGPWDRLDGDAPFVPGVGPKPPGANFYPPDLTREAFEAADLPGKDGQYSLIRRSEGGALTVVPYHEAYAAELQQAATLLREAAALAEDAGLRRYLELRAEALVTDDYTASDLAWLEAKTNRVDVVIGPIEVYEDALFNQRAAYEAYVLVKDQGWSDRLARYATLLPSLQEALPVPAEYRRERPGTDSDLNAYDVLYYAGHANAGSKTIAINLPNDEQVQLARGTRRLQLKNAMRAKFDQILTPIGAELIAPDQLPNVTFDAFFSNVMFHEVAHGLGIKHLVRGEGTVRDALKERGSALEEAKADILGLYLITALFDRGEIREGQLLDHYVTFLAGLFRSVRFGAASAHGVANMVELNFLAAQGAFTRDPATGTYRVDPEKMRPAVEALATKILTLQGDGDYAGVGALYTDIGVVGPELQADLDRLGQRGIPVDVVFEQGLEVLGLAAPAAE